MASVGYSGTPLPQKLELKPGLRLKVLHDPGSFAVDLGHPYDVIVLFVSWRQDLEAELSEAIHTLADRGGLWIAWPKKASRAPTDITEGTLREVILPMGLVDNKVCAIDEKWSGLRFVRRLTP